MIDRLHDCQEYDLTLRCFLNILDYNIVQLGIDHFNKLHSANISLNNNQIVFETIDNIMDYRGISPNEYNHVLKSIYAFNTKNKQSFQSHFQKYSSITPSKKVQYPCIKKAHLEMSKDKSYQVEVQAISRYL